MSEDQNLKEINRADHLLYFQNFLKMYLKL
jgi:hypothetical protein